MGKPKILARFRPWDQELLEKFCQKKSRDSVRVSMLPRFGFSGARLFIVNFTERGLPEILKVAPFDKAKEEFEALHSMRDIGVEDCTRVCDANEQLLVSNSREWGAIVYPHMGTDQTAAAEDSVTLKQRLFLAGGELGALSDATLKATLNEIFERLENAHRDPNWKSCRLQKVYGAYFRQHKSQIRIRQILGRLAEKQVFSFLGADLYNPLKLIDSIPKFARLPMGRVHGDLHPDNVVLHRFGTPHLIDFAWAKNERDILVDFVLMENSIRFRDFPRTVNLEEQLPVDDALAQNGSFSDVQTFSSRDGKNRSAYKRLASILSVIRRSAKNALGNGFSVERYLFCQFILLYGLIRYDGYEPYTSVRALGMMAKRLHQTRWDFLDI